jgi:hypothetical protein
MIPPIWRGGKSRIFGGWLCRHPWQRDQLRKIIPHLLEHLLHLMQFDRPLALFLILTQDMNLAAGDLVSLERALLGMEGPHIADKGTRDGERQF